MNTAMDNSQAVDRRRTGQASRSPLEVLEQLPTLVLPERIPVPTLAVLRCFTKQRISITRSSH
jgi:hypothetical protein